MHVLEQVLQHGEQFLRLGARAPVCDSCWIAFSIASRSLAVITLALAGGGPVECAPFCASACKYFCSACSWRDSSLNT
jgi:hypothetical protein